MINSFSDCSKMRTSSIETWLDPVFGILLVSCPLEKCCGGWWGKSPFYQNEKGGRFFLLLKCLRRSVNPRRVMDLGSDSQLPQTARMNIRFWAWIQTVSREIIHPCSVTQLWTGLQNLLALRSEVSFIWISKSISTVAVLPLPHTASIQDAWRCWEKGLDPMSSLFKTGSVQADDLLILHLLMPFSNTGTKNHKACFEAGTLSHEWKWVSS